MNTGPYTYAKENVYFKRYFYSTNSPVLQAVQGLVHILLVEAGHVAVHVRVVVADVALRAPVGHRAEPEGRREVVGLLELLGEEGGLWCLP